MKTNETLLAVAGIAIVGYVLCKKRKSAAIGYVIKKKRNSASSTPGIGTTKNQKFYDAVKESIIRNSKDLTGMEWRESLARYRRYFRREPDYNYAQYGNLLVSPYQVLELMEECGYKAKNYSPDRAWDFYLRTVGAAIRDLLS